MGSVLGVFDKAYFISVPRREDRRRHLLPELARVGITEAEWFPAITPSQGKGAMNAGRLGCRQSHLEVVRRAKKEGFRNVLILEDDVIFSKDFNNRWPLYADMLREIDWNTFHFGPHFIDPPKSVRPNLYEVRRHNLLHCYALNASAFDLYISEMGADDDRFADFVFADVATRLGNAYCPNPFLAWQRDGFSDLVGEELRIWSDQIGRMEELIGFR
jgi:hypothetical protein